VDAGAKAAEEATEKERDEHFNTIRWMIPIKQEWRVKEKTSTPMLTTYDDDMDLLDDNKSPLIKDGSPPPTIKEHGVHAAGRVQGHRGGDHSDVPWSHAGHVQEA
jgi:hypothetical protein